ncbi:hypothetical protein CH296_00370 [Rhodococcus sp. 14-2496-1d]|uniref:hypothetical protein n=1 Tax=Rhodococcus sp. 14-2496-1d TaxID=2023146 RepID=UPI000B9BB44C|nr:hypothetical protein [Rhodococcus sp. 14-2496-1d]OZF40746.1 hypothetical protein CH296_00370 [Rhodococcus sp. 14-2496-1d]
MATELAVAYVSMLPEARNFVPEFNRQVGPGLARSGTEQGQKFGTGFTGSLGRVGSLVTRTGRSQGDNFGNAFTSTSQRGVNTGLTRGLAGVGSIGRDQGSRFGTAFAGGIDTNAATKKISNDLGRQSTALARVGKGQGEDYGRSFSTEAAALIAAVPGLAGELNRNVGPEMENAGREQGSRFASSFSSEASSGISTVGGAISAAAVNANEAANARDAAEQGESAPGANDSFTGEIAGFAAGAAAISFLTQSLQDVQGVETLAAQTASVIKSTGGAAQVTAEHVGDLAENIEAMTSVEMEGTVAGANFLLTFKNIQNQAGDGNDVFDQTVQAMTDMSVAMGTDAKGSALQLGKALNDPIKGVSALAKVGITFSAEQKTQIEQMVAQNDLLGAQKIILAEVNSQFAGSAVAFGETTAGGIAKAQNALGNFGEEIAGRVIPAVNALSSFLLPVFDGLAGNTDTVLAVVAAFVAWKVIPPILSNVSAATARAIATTRMLATTQGGIINTSRVGAVQMGRFGTAIQQIGASRPAIAGIQGAFVNAATGAARFSTAAGLAAASGTALKLAGGGIVSALGGPFGVAVLAAGAALFFWMKKNQEAKAAAEANKAAVEALSGTLDAQTGAVTANTIASQAKILAESGLIESARNYGIAEGDLVAAHLNQEGALGRVNKVVQENIRKSTEASNVYKSNVEGYERAGVSLNDLTAALGGNSEKYDDVKSKLDAYNTTLSAAGASETDKVASLDRLKNSLDAAGVGAVDMATSIGTTNDQLSDAQRIQEDTALAMDQGTETASAFSEAIDKISDSASTAEDRTSALKAAIDALNGNPLDLEQANSTLQDAFANTQEAVKPKEGEAAPTVNLDTNTIDVATEAGRKLLDVTVAQQEATLDAARAARDAGLANGDLAGAQGAAATVVEQSRQKFLEQIGTLGIVGDQAQRLADKYIGIPSVVATLIDQPNMAASQLALDILKGKVDLVPDDKKITVDTLDADAIKRLEGLNYKVTTLPDGQVEIEALTAEAETAIQGLLKPRQVSVNFAIENPGAVSAAITEAEAATGRRINRGQFANGGPLVGGLPGRDSIPILGMPGEHMLDVNDVRRLGGQEGVYRFRAALAAGQVGAYATGGAVERARTNAQADNGKSYIWGDRDCSMFMSWIHSDLMGLERKRLYTTSTLMAGQTAGLERGTGDGNTHFLVGVNSEHMAGTLDGVNVEAGGAGGNVQYGGTAAGAFDPQFTQVFFLPDSLLNPPPDIAATIGEVDPITGERIVTGGSASSAGTASAATPAEPQRFSVADRMKKLGADLSSVAVDAFFEQLPFGIGESRFLTTPILTEAPNAAQSFTDTDLANQQPVTTGAPNWVEDMLKALRRPAADVPIFDQGGVVGPGLNLINNATGANEVLANVTGLLGSEPAAAVPADYSIRIDKVEGSNADEIIRKITALQSKQAVRYAGRPF